MENQGRLDRIADVRNDLVREIDGVVEEAVHASAPDGYDIGLVVLRKIRDAVRQAREVQARHHHATNYAGAGADE